MENFKARGIDADSQGECGRRHDAEDLSQGDGESDVNGQK